jgi:hypothetical protein
VHRFHSESSFCSRVVVSLDRIMECAPDKTNTVAVVSWNSRNAAQHIRVTSSRMHGSCWRIIWSAVALSTYTN